MAVTKTHPIKSTLKKALDYICNPAKTDGKRLVSPFGCSAESAVWTRKHSMDKGTHLGHYLIQAFEPGETTPEGVCYKRCFNNIENMGSSRLVCGRISGSAKGW